MTPFKFSLQDRVTIKTEDLGAVEGVVSGCKTMINQPHEYDVHFLQLDLSLAHIVIKEDDLAAAQPSKNSISVKVEVDGTDLDTALTKARELRKLTKARKPASRKRSRR